MKFNLKKFLNFIVVFILFFLNVCKTNALNIDVSDAKMTNKNASAKVGKTTFKENTIDSKIVLNKVGSYVEYEITLDNKESTKYTIRKISNNLKNKNIKISYNSEELKNNDKAKLNIRIKYDKKIQDSIKEKNLTLTLNLKEEDNILLYFICLITATIGIIFIITTRKHKNLRLIVITITIIPILILLYWSLATEKYKINLDNITVIGYNSSSRSSGDGISSFKISIDPANGDDPIEKIIDYGDKIGELPENPTKEGYEFEGWIDDKGNPVNEDTEVNEEIYIEAKYKSIEYKISYELNGGENNIDNPNTYTTDANDFKLKDPIRSTYTFTGWTGSNGKEEQKNVIVKNGTKGDLKYEAHFSKSANKLNIELENTQYEYSGKKIEPKVVIKDENIVLKENVDYTIKYVDNIDSGKAKVIITMTGKYNDSTDATYEGSSIIEFTINKATPKVNVSDKKYIYTGSNITIDTKDVKVTPNTGGKIIIKYYTDSKLQNEIKDVIEAGTYYYRAEVEETKNYTKAYSEVKKLKIERKSIDIPVQTENIIYNGLEQVLREDTEYYTVSGSTKGTNAGTYHITVTPTDNYAWPDGTTASKIIEIVISPYNISEAFVNSISNETYDGNYHTPTPNVVVPLPSVDNPTTLTNNDRTYSYSNNKNAGTATIKITGKGNYTGIITKEFTIDKKEVTYTAKNQEKIYDGTALTADETCELTSGTLVTGHTATCVSSGTITEYIEDGVVKTLDRVTIKNGSTDVTSNYEITKVNGLLKINKRETTCTSNNGTKVYDGSPLTVAGGTCTNLASGQTSVFTNTGSITNVSESGTKNNTINNIVLKSGSTDVTNNYNITSVAGNLSITKRPLTVRAKDQSKIYDSTPLNADSTCTITSGTLAPNESITCTSTGSITNVGSTTKTLSSVVINNSDRQTTDNYNITKVNGTLTVERKVTDVPTQSSDKLIYNTTEQTLLSNTDKYTVSGSTKATNVGEYEITVTPTGNYSWPDGSTSAKTVIYTIEPYDISGASVTPIPSVIYNGQLHTPTPSVTVPLPSTDNPTTLTSSDITYSYLDNKNAGTAKVTITGKGNYKGTITKEFTINKANGYVNLSENNKNIVYGTNTVTFNITSTHGGEIVITDDNSTVTEALNSNRVTVTNLGELTSGTIVNIIIKSKETKNYKEASTTYELKVSNSTLSGGSVTIKGHNVVGQTLTTEVMDTTPIGRYTYKWYRNETNSTTGGTAIAGATGLDYTVTNDDIGKYIYVEVTASRDNYDSVKFSDIVDAEENDSIIAKTSSPIPTSSTYCKTVKYTGTNQVLTNLSGTGYAFYNNSGKDVGNYTITAKLQDNYIWSDYTTGDKTFTCRIDKSDTTTTLGSIASKTYDGIPLTASGATSALTSNNSSISGTYTYTYYNGTSCSGTALSGAPINAGDYSVKATLNETSSYNSSTSGCVSLKINPKSITCTSNSGTKVYDGTPLTVAGGTCTGLLTGHTATLNNSGSINEAYRLLGDANVDGEITEADEDLIKKYMMHTDDLTALGFGNADINNDGTVNLTDITAIKRHYKGIEAIEPVGDGKNTIASVVVKNGSVDVTNNYAVTKVEGSLRITPKEISLSTTDESKVYDGDSLTANNNCTVSTGSLVSGDSITCNNSGTITDVGSVTKYISTIVITKGSTNVTRNYAINRGRATLTVTPKSITCTSNSGTKVYDGTPLTVSGGSCTGQLTGHTATVTTNGSVTDAYRLLGDADLDGNITENDVERIKDHLTKVSILSPNAYGNADVNRDGDVNTIDITAIKRHLIGAEIIEPVGDGKNTIASVVVKDDGTNVTNNYTITEVEGSLRITPKDITCTSSDGTKVYDGTELTASGGSCTGLVSGHTSTFTNSGSSTTIYRLIGDINMDGVIDDNDLSDLQNYVNGYNINISTINSDINKDGSISMNDISQLQLYLGGNKNAFVTPIGEVDNTIRSIVIKNGNTNLTSNYNISKIPGKLKLLPREVTFQTTNQSKTYDGTTLSATNDCTIKTGTLVSGHTFTCINEGNITDVGSKSKKIKSVTINDDNTNVTDNYNIFKEHATLTVTPKKLESVTNLTVSPDGVVSWTNSEDADGYEISINNGSYMNATNGKNYLSEIISTTGEKTIKVRAISNSDNYITSDVASKIVNVYKITINSNNTDYGTVNTSTYNVISGTTYSTNDNELLIKSGSTILKTITATRKTKYVLDNWSSASGTINSNLTITATFRLGVSMLKNGHSISVDMKKLANNLEDLSELGQARIDYNIKHFKRSNNLPDNSFTNIKDISYDTSDFPVYIWFDSSDNTIYYYAESDKIYLNENGGFLFYRLESLTDVEISDFDTSKAKSLHSLFDGCKSLESVDVTHFDTSNVTDMSEMFFECNSLRNLDVTHFDTKNVTNMSRMFYGCNNLESLDVAHFDTREVTDMSYMFAVCRSLTELDLTHFNTSKVTNMSSMFSGCSNLENIDVTHFDTKNVTNMNNMFSRCKNLTSLDVTHFNTSKVTNMWGIFGSCEGLTSIDVSNFDTSKVTDMSEMFFNCKNLESIDVSNFDTSNNKDFRSIFYGLEKIKTLDVSNFDTSNVEIFHYMFANCSNLKTIYASDSFVVKDSASTDGIFQNDTNLVGGNGTSCSGAYSGLSQYAVIDTPTTPGYFTAKN